MNPAPATAEPMWSVIVPVKQLSAAKSRLGRPDRAALALAMAQDTVRAASAAAHVAQVVVVTDDPAALRALRGPGVRVVPDLPRAGLNAALRHAAGLLAADAGSAPGGGLAALSADLPAMRPAELDLALQQATGYPRAFLADAQGTGTVLLTTNTGRDLRPSYGPGSRLAHAGSGAHDLTADIGDQVPGLRRDVDTVADLTVAVHLGVGPATAAIA